MFNSAMVTSLEMIASTLETTCDEVLSYMQTHHWQTAFIDGACADVPTITTHMQEWLDLRFHQILREDIAWYKKCQDDIGLNTSISWIQNKIQELKKSGVTSWEWLGIFSNPQEEINVLKNILAEV